MADLWSYVSTVSKPVVLYGTGDGADKILRVLDRRGIRIQGVFASDGFVRHRTFHGFPVLSYAETKETLGDFLVLVAFASSLPGVMDNIRRIRAESELYVPDVPVAGENIFDAEFVLLHQEELSQARDLLSDDASRALFDDMISFRLTGDLRYLTDNASSPESVYTDILHPEAFRLTADLGAFTGDTAAALLRYAPQLQTLIALEPDPRTFQRLIKNIGENGVTEAYNLGAWNEEATLTFSAGGSRATHITASSAETSPKSVPLRMQALDRILNSRPIDFIKFDVEGAEKQAIQGAANAISHCRPELAVSVYHRSEDLFSLPLMLSEMLPHCRFFLRRPPYIPAWDLTLYAVPEKC